MNEADRLVEVLRLGILDTAPEPEFDEACALAAESLGCPFALITLIDRDRQWAKACHGWDLKQVDRAVSVCSYNLSSGVPMVVPNALDDERFQENPMVLEDPQIRFYAGAPLVTRSGATVGSLCVLSPEARPGGADGKQLAVLSGLAGLVMRIMEYRVDSGNLQLFRAFVNSMQDGVMVCEEPLDPPGPRIQWVNPAFTEMTGYTFEEVVGKTPRILQGPESSPAELKKMSDGLRASGRVSAGLINYRKDGTPFWVDLDINPIRCNSGKVTHRVSIQRDVTRQVAHSPQGLDDFRYRQLVEFTNEMIWDWDLRTQTMYRTPALERLLGPTPELGEELDCWGQSVHPEDWVRVRDGLRAAIEEKKPWSAEYRLRRNCGEYLTVNDRATVLTDSAGIAVRVIGAMIDVTTIREAQRQAEQASRKLEIVLESANDGVALIGVDGQVAYTNRRLTEMTGGRDLCGFTVADLYREGESGPFQESYRLAQASGAPASADGFSPALGFWAEANAYPSDDGVTIFIKDISAQKQSAQELEKKSREAQLADGKLRRMFDQSIDMICLVDAAGRFVEISSAVRTILGYDENELVGTLYWDLLHPSDWEQTQALAANLTSGQAVRNFQNRYRRKDGTYANLLWSAVWSEQDQLRFAIGRDITDQAEASRRLMRSEANLARAQRVAHIGSWTVNLESETSEWSEEQYRIFGVAADSTSRTTQKFNDLVHPEDLEGMIRARTHAIKTGTRMDHEHRIVRPDGSIRYVHHIGEATVDETGQRIFFGTTQDVTEPRESERKLKNTEALYRSLFEKYPHPMWIYDTQTLRFLAVNAAAVDTYGYCEEEFLSMTILDISPKEDIPKVLRLFETSPSELAASGVWRHRTKSGKNLFAEVVSNPTRFAGREGRLVLSTNVTEKMALEEQLRQSQKMEAVGQLAGGIAHDFNNLLTVINGYADLLMQRAGETEHRELGHIREAGERAAQMTSQLLAFGRKQVLQLRLVNLNQLIAGMRPMLNRLISESIEIEIEADPDIDHVRADPTQLEQMIMNLAINARDAMPRGGVLTIQTSAITITPGDLGNAPGCAPGPYALLTIRDTGHGIPEELLPHIFEPFFTTKETGRGTGLGLSMVYGIVTQSGGHIAVETERDRGTTFKVYLPNVQGLDEEVTEKAMEPGIDLTGTERVMVVEDDPSVREFVVAVLQDAGYSVLQASSGAEAILIAGREPRPIDLLVTDVVLPKINGKDLADFLISQWPGLRVILMSGYPEQGGVRLGIMEPAMNFIAKPFTPAALKNQVRQVLSSAARQRHVLLVDDELGVLAVCKDALEGSGYAVRTATDGKEAMHRLDDGPVDLVITDLVMPEQEGIETIQQIRRRFPNTKIIAVSGFAGGSFLKVAQLLGADQVLQKPFGPDVLVSKVKALIG